MTPSSRTYTGIILILFGGSTLFGARGQHAVDFPLMKQRSNKPPQTHTNENSLSGLQVIHILITPLPRDKRP